MQLDNQPRLSAAKPQLINVSIKPAGDPLGLVQDVRSDHRLLEFVVSKQGLNRPDISPSPKQLGRQLTATRPAPLHGSTKKAQTKRKTAVLCALAYGNFSKRAKYSSIALEQASVSSPMRVRNRFSPALTSAKDAFPGLGAEGVVPRCGIDLTDFPVRILQRWLRDPLLQHRTLLM